MGFFAAAVRYAPVVRYNKLHVYVNSEDVEKFVNDLELKEVSSGENVRLIVPHDNTPLLYARKINNNLIIIVKNVMQGIKHQTRNPYASDMYYN